MSGSYTFEEEWQQKKSMLIKSLFHDVPKLSSVEEESTDSSQDQAPRHEVFPSLPTPYSPLPPLIIERVPLTNKHDEPEEYYIKLHKKMARLYRKLLFEKRNFSSVENDSISYDSSDNDDITVISSDGSESVENLDLRFLESISPKNKRFKCSIEDRRDRQSSGSTKSTGYGEESDNENFNEDDISDGGLDNWRSSDYTNSNKEIIDTKASNKERNSRHSTIHDEEMSESGKCNEKVGQSYVSTKSTGYREESDTENLNEDDISSGGLDNWRSSDYKDSNKEIIDDEASNKEQNSRHSTIHDEEMTESGKYNETVGQSYEEEESNHENIDENEINETYQTKNSQHSSESENEQQSVKQTKTDTDSHDSERKSNRGEKINASQGRRESIVSNAAPVAAPMEVDVETSTSSEGPVYRQITTEALVHVDGSKDAAARESRVYEDSEKSPRLPTRFKRVVSRHVDDRIGTTVLDEKDGPVYRQITTEALVHVDGSKDAEARESRVYEDSEKSPRLPTRFKRVVSRHVGDRISIAVLEEKDGPVYRQITTEALVHVDGSKDAEAREIRVYEDSVKSPIIPTTFKRVVSRHVDDRNGTAVLEEKDDPKPAPIIDSEDFEEIRTHQAAIRDEHCEEMRFSPDDDIDEDTGAMRTSAHETTEKEVEEMGTPRLEISTPTSELTDEEDGEENDEEMGSAHPIEQMRTPRQDLSHGTIPRTHVSSSESTNEHTVVLQEATAMTSSSQDGVEQNISGLQTSHDMNEILTSIFNESRSKKEAPVSGRKTKHVDTSLKAVLTKKVTWDEIRANFFVGTPKIFRLCASTNHVRR